jgi:MYXO-CTERM domain-containing protein
MLTRRVVTSSRSSVSMVTLAAILFFVWTPWSWADAFAGSNIVFDSNVATTGPSFTFPPSLLETNPPPSVVNTSSGFSISGLNYMVTNSSANPSSGDVIWTATRAFTVTGPLSATVGISGDVGSITTTGSVSGTITISASIFEVVSNVSTLVPGSTVSSSAFSISSAPFSWEVGLPGGVPLAAGSYLLQLQSDLSLSSISSGGSITVDPNYGVGVDPVPEPSTLTLFAGLGAMALAGAAGRRWQRRRRRGRDHLAAGLPCG